MTADNTRPASGGFNDDHLRWKILSTEYLIRRPWLTARKDQVQLPDGRVHPEYYVLEYPGWVNVIAETKEGLLVLERQYRHGLGQVSTEICAGCIEEGEDPLTAAQRELWEETGYTGGRWTLLTTLSPNASAMNNLSYSFLAQGVEQTSTQHLDPNEDIHVFLATKEDTLDMLRQGQFLQALMVAPLWQFFAEHTDLLK